MALAAMAMSDPAAAYKVGQIVQVSKGTVLVATLKGLAQERNGQLLLVPRPAAGNSPACPAAWQPVYLLSSEWNRDLNLPDAPGKPPRTWWLCWSAPPAPSPPTR